MRDACASDGANSTVVQQRRSNIVVRGGLRVQTRSLEGERWVRVIQCSRMRQVHDVCCATPTAMREPGHQRGLHCLPPSRHVWNRTRQSIRRRRQWHAEADFIFTAEVRDRVGWLTVALQRIVHPVRARVVRKACFVQLCHRLTPVHAVLTLRGHQRCSTPAAQVRDRLTLVPHDLAQHVVQLGRVHSSTRVAVHGYPPHR